MFKSNFLSLHEASKEILIETTNIVKNTKEEFVIVGGWGPVLRNDSVYEHPGTLDVDLLFFGGNVKQQLKKVAEELIKNSYIPSAKHDFQLLKEIIIKGQKLLFNVDLMHPNESNVTDFFVNHLDLGIRFDYDLPKTKVVKSIALPSSKFIKDYSLFENFKVDSIEIPLITFAGLIFTKCKSFKQIKRPRDSFDIFLTFTQKNKDEIVQKIKKVCQDEPELNKAILGMKEHILNEKIAFNDNVQKYLSNPISDNPAHIVLTELSIIC